MSDMPDNTVGTLVSVKCVAASEIADVGPRDGTNVIVLQFEREGGELLTPLFLMLGDAALLAQGVAEAVRREAARNKVLFGSL